MKLTIKTVSRLYDGCAALLLGTMFFLMISGAIDDSPIADEIIHLHSGYATVGSLSVQSNPEHPLFIKILSAFPLLFLDIPEKTLFSPANEVDHIILTARIPNMLLTVCLGILLYVWLSRLFGKRWGLLGLALLAFEPNIIAHSRFVTTDTGMTFFLFLTLFLFVRFVADPTIRNTVLCSVALCLALLSKYSSVSILPVLAVFIFAFWMVPRMTRMKNRVSESAKLSLRAVRMFPLILLYCCAGIYIFYLLFTWNGWMTEVEVSFSGFAADHFLLRPILAFWYGMLLVVTHTQEGHFFSQYLNGDFSFSGWSLYFPEAFALKSTIPFLLLCFIALGSLFFWQRKKTENADSAILTSVLLLLLFFGVFTLMSLMANLNIGIRHILPLYPVMFFLTVAGIAALYARIQAAVFKRIFTALIIVLCGWHAASTLAIHPHQLSYFNELAGGPEKGHRYLIDSNIDWGQDVKRLADWSRAEDIRGLKIDIFAPPEVVDYYFSGQDYNIWDLSFGTPQNGLFATSIHRIYMGEYIRQTGRISESYLPLLDRDPVARIGYGIYVYDFGDGM